MIFSSERTGTAQLYLIKADGTGLTRLFNNPETDDARAQWSQDGKSIVFNRGKDGTIEILIARISLIEK